MDLFTLIVIDHVLLQMSLVAENFSTECARKFVDDMCVPEVIFEHSL